MSRLVVHFASVGPSRVVNGNAKYAPDSPMTVTPERRRES
jgi:hypothetical protein